MDLWEKTGYLCVLWRDMKISDFVIFVLKYVYRESKPFKVLCSVSKGFIILNSN